MPPQNAHPLAIKAAANAETTAPAKNTRLIENMLALPVSLLLFVVPSTTDPKSKGWANVCLHHIYLFFFVIHARRD